MRLLAQSAFIEEGQDAPLPQLFFNGRPHFLLPVLDLLLVAFPGSSHGALGTPTQSDQNLPHLSFVIADAKLLLDQVRHPRAGPQRSFIAQPLGTLQQQWKGIAILCGSR